MMEAYIFFLVIIIADNSKDCPVQLKRIQKISHIRVLFVKVSHAIFRIKRFCPGCNVQSVGTYINYVTNCMLVIVKFLIKKHFLLNSWLGSKYNHKKKSK